MMRERREVRLYCDKYYCLLIHPSPAKHTNTNTARTKMLSTQSNAGSRIAVLTNPVLQEACIQNSVDINQLSPIEADNPCSNDTDQSRAGSGAGAPTRSWTMRCLNSSGSGALTPLS